MRKLLALLIAISCFGSVAIADGLSGSIGGGIGGGIGQFDGGISGKVGVTPTVIIDEQFTTTTYFPGPITSDLVDTRSTTKYVTNASGVLSQVGANVLPISNAGMLVEPAATNLSLWSQDFTNAAWATYTFGAGTIATTAASGLAPDGTNTATLITLFRSVATDAARLNNVFTGTAAPYTGSLYVKANGVGDIGNTIDIVFYNGSAVLTVVPVVMTANWQHVARTDTMAAASCQFIFGYFESSFGGSPQTGTTNILTWQGDVDMESVASSPIATTTAAAARAADSIVVQRTGIGRMVFTFDDTSQQTISGINTAAQYTIPTNLNRPLITRMTGYSF